MRGASRGSLAHAKERLATLTDGSSVAARLGEELFAVVVLLDSQTALRRALADPASSGRARADLITTVLGDQVSEDTIGLISEVVAGQWSAAADLADATEQLAALAIITDADQHGHLDDVEDELFRFGRVVGSEPALRAALSNAFAPAQAKQDVISALLSGKARQETIQLVTQAALHPRGRSLDASLEVYAALAAEHRERLVAEVRVAGPLRPAQQRRLAEALAAAYGHNVHLNVVLDPAVVGGMIVRIGGEQIDGSVATRLAEIRRRLAA
jgi:F-type H+-transporting ATPase subunit delta